MASVEKSYIINNFFDRSYTVTIYFNKGVDIKAFLDYVKKHVVEKDLVWKNNVFSFKSKEPRLDLYNKYTCFFKNIKEKKIRDCFLSFKLSFDNFNNAITIFTIVEKSITNDIKSFIDEFVKAVNVFINKLDINIKHTFITQQNKEFNILSYALIHDDKLLITIDNVFYTVLNVLFASEEKLFELTKQERNERLKQKKIFDSYLFTFELNNKHYGFKEFLNICKICKNYHYDFNKKNCVSVCVPCGTVKEENHVCVNDIENTLKDKNNDLETKGSPKNVSINPPKSSPKNSSENLAENLSDNSSENSSENSFENSSENSSEYSSCSEHEITVNSSSPKSTIDTKKLKNIKKKMEKEKEKEKKKYCGLCKLYLNILLKHTPLDKKCEHKKNIHTEMFINTRQRVLLNILRKNIEVIKPEPETFIMNDQDFPILKKKY